MLDKLTAKFGTDRPAEAPPRAFGLPVVCIPVTLIASLLAFHVAAILLGAHVPAISKEGVIGPALGGEYPFHMALFALIGIALAVPARRSGLVRRCPAVTVVTALSAIAALVIAGVQFAAARKEGSGVSSATPSPLRSPPRPPTAGTCLGDTADSHEPSGVTERRKLHDHRGSRLLDSGVRPHQRDTPTAGA